MEKKCRNGENLSIIIVETTSTTTTTTYDWRGRHRCCIGICNFTSMSQFEVIERHTVQRTTYPAHAHTHKHRALQCTVHTAHLPTTRSHCFSSDPAAAVLSDNAFGIRCVNLARVINSSENIFTSFASSVRISCCVNSALVAHCVRRPSNRSADMSIMLWMTSSPCRILFVSYSADWFVVILSLAIPYIHGRPSNVNRLHTSQINFYFN